MKWGMHEVDASHQLSAWVEEAVLLLLELVPAASGQSALAYFRIRAHELQRLSITIK